MSVVDEHSSLLQSLAQLRYRNENARRKGFAVREKIRQSTAAAQALPG